LIIYARSIFWSMGEGIGAGAFWRTPRALAERGHEVHIVLPAPAGQPGGEEVRDGVHLHRYPSKHEFVFPMAVLPVRLAMRVWIYSAYQRIGARTAMEVARAVRPDLVLAFGTFEAPVARKVAQALKVPNVTRLFGNSLSLTLRDPVRYHLNFPEVRAFRTPCARLILTNDGADGEAVAQHNGVPPERFVHLRNGLDFGLFTPGPAAPEVFQRLGLPEGTPLLMTVTRLAIEKKLERLIDAMPDLLARVPRAVAVLVGEGDERAHLEARAREMGVSHAVKMPGAVPSGELPAWYRSAAIVLSLLDRTNASNPVFEGMACERCVVALDAGTTRELVHNGETGILLPVDDLPKLGSVLADLVLDPERRARLGRAARAHIRALLLDPPARMDQEIEILLKVIDEGWRR
jgi:glycosyltransferase involved in cell wall biosynthesis